MKQPKHIVWYADLNKLDFTHPWVKKWWLEQVLIHGRAEDVHRLDFGELEQALTNLNLPPVLKSLWTDYFTVRKK